MKKMKGLSKKKKERKKTKENTHRHRQQYGEYQRAKQVGGGRKGYRRDKWCRKET